MPRTPVYIVSSPRPDVGKTLLSRLLTEFLLLQNGRVQAFDINLREPSLVNFQPRVTETASIGDTYAKMQLMDRLIVNDHVSKVIDLGLHAFEDFFQMADEIGFMKEAIRRNIEPVIIYMPDLTQGSSIGWAMLQERFADSVLIAVDNEHVLFGETPKGFGNVTPLHIAALPPFLKSIISRTSFSFTDYLRSTHDQSAELHQWVRRNYLNFREMERVLRRR